jgi:tetratricopeptide (TPR) repeat protein
MKRWLLIALGILAALTLFSGISLTGKDELAVLDPRFGEPEVLESGIHFHLPFLSRVTRYPLEPRKVEGETKVETRDNLNFRIRFTLEQRFDPDSVLEFHARRAGRPLDPVLRQLSEESLQKASALLPADEILGPTPRERWLAVLTPPCRERGLKALGVEVRPLDPRVMVNAALVYQERNLPTAAFEMARLAVERYPDSALPLYGLGRIYEHQGKLKEAEDRYVQALFLDPAAPEPMARLVGMLLKQREFGRAQRLINAALDKARGSAPHFNWLGLTLQFQAKYDEAKLAFQKATDLDPKNAEYQANFGAMLLAQDDYAGAQEHLKEALRLQPNFPLALYNLGVALAASGRAAEAIPFFEQAEKSGPPTPGLLNALSQAYEEIGDRPNAISALERSLQLRPNQPDQIQRLRQLRSGRPASGTGRKS